MREPFDDAAAHARHRLRRDHRIQNCFFRRVDRRVEDLRDLLVGEEVYPSSTRVRIRRADPADGWSGHDRSGKHWSEDDWQQIAARARLEEEEHNPKLVFVLGRIWRRTNRASLFRAAAGQFTRTPELPPSFEQPPTE